MDETRTLNEYDQDSITELLLGRRVVRAEGSELELDNGVVIEAEGNQGCGGCTSGWYHLETLNRVDNAITRVEFDYAPDDDDYESGGHYTIFVYAEQEQINLVQFNGSDGNGYYGTGFELQVRMPA